MAEPEIRATWAKYTVGSIKRMPPSQRTPLLNALEGPLREEIRLASSLGWQPARVFSSLCANIAQCGRETALAFWRTSLRESIEKPLINVIVQGGLTVLGHSPMALVARTPSAWGLVSRACGTIRFERGEQSQTAMLIVEDLPAVCREHTGLLLMWEGGLYGQGDYVKTRVNVLVDARDFARDGRAKFTVQW